MLLIVHAQPIIAEALAHRLAAVDDITVVGYVVRHGDAESLVGVEPPTVALVEWAPQADGLDTMRRIRRRSPATGIVVLAPDGHGFDVQAAVDSGASAVVNTSQQIADLVSAIRAADASRSSSRGSLTHAVLTVREVEVLRFAACGLSNRQIADRMFLSEHTVLGYLKSIFAKLGTHSKLQAVLRGISDGIIDLPMAIEGPSLGDPDPVTGRVSGR